MQPVSSVETIVVGECNNCGCREQVEVGGGIDFEYATCSNEFFFVRCPDCGLVYLRNRPAAAALSMIYPKEYIPHHFEEHLGGLISRLRRHVQRRKVRPFSSRLQEGATIIDVGPGNGEFLDLLRRHGDASWKLYGVDFAQEAIDALRELKLNAVRSRFEELQWEGPPPDAIVMNQVIEHLEDPARCVEHAFGLLSPGGYLVLETPSVDSWDYKLFHRRYWGGWHIPRHWVLYDPSTLSDLARRSGFEVVEITHLLSPNFWLQSIHHMLLEKPRAKQFARFFDVSFLPALALASGLDVLQLAVRRKTSNFRLVARKPASVSRITRQAIPI